MNSKSIIKNIILFRKNLIVSLSLMIVVTVAFRILNPLLLRHVVNKVIENDAQSGEIIFFSVLVLTLTFLTFVLEARRVTKASTLGGDISSALSEKAYSAILRSELLDFNKLDQETTMKRIMNDTEEIGTKYFGRNLIPFVHESLIFMGLLISLATIGPWYFLITVLTLPPYYLLVRYIKKMLNKSAENSKQILEQQSQILNENFGKLKNIKLYNGIKAEEERYSKLVQKIEKNNSKDYSLKNYSYGFASSFLVDIIFSIIIWVGAFALLGKNATSQIGTILVSFIIIPQIFNSFSKIQDLKIHPENIQQYITQLDEIYSLKPENRADTVQQLDEIYSLKFKDVCFDYGQGSTFELDTINFEIKKGEKLGILGLGNSGKTTIADLMTKIIRPKQGSVLLNNCDLNKINSYYLRELISVIPQNIKLINDTIQNNVTYPLPFDEYKYNDALNKTNLKPIISRLEARDQTLITDDSKLLTESESQLIAIANAFYKDSKIFLLDEATSKFDQKTENEIMEEVYKLKNKIILIMSNRIHNLVNCDKIIVLNNGRILEYGKTSELLSDQKSTFARMVKDLDQTKSKVV